MSRTPRTASAAALLAHMEELRSVHVGVEYHDNQYQRTDGNARRDTWSTAIKLLETELGYIEEDSVELALARGEVKRVLVAVSS